ncbi:MAG: succinyl-diaminopimelate desuccinylase [Gammaproteobacteria bacterium]
MSNTLELAQQLIARASVTPEDNGCQQLLAERLQALGFHIEHLRYDDVDNLWARLGSEAPLLVFAGHTDVVPTGPLKQWKHDPFTPTIDNGKLYGRGAADMKSSIAAMVCACESVLPTHKLRGSIGFLITSDEEGPSINGTVKVIEHLENRNEKIDWCLVGEPSSTNHVGDVIKNGRRGSISGNLTIHGTQGHIAYPHLADNPVHRFAPALNALVNEAWDEGNEFFPPTTFQISNIHAGTGANNVIPGDLDIMFNFRFSTALTADDIKQRTHALLDAHNLKYTLEWTLSGHPFLTPGGELVRAALAAIKAVNGLDCELSTAGGTSDGRFIAPTGAQVAELGPINASIHKIDEHVDIAQLDELYEIYRHIIIDLLG